MMLLSLILDFLHKTTAIFQEFCFIHSVGPIEQTVFKVLTRSSAHSQSPSEATLMPAMRTSLYGELHLYQECRVQQSALTRCRLRPHSYSYPNGAACRDYAVHCQSTKRAR